eukprot:COSAG01_NODE_903_length_12848_cov_7.966899_14_plen_108_part_00
MPPPDPHRNPSAPRPPADVRACVRACVHAAAVCAGGRTGPTAELNFSMISGLFNHTASKLAPQDLSAVYAFEFSNEVMPPPPPPPRAPVSPASPARHQARCSRGRAC